MHNSYDFDVLGEDSIENEVVFEAAYPPTANSVQARRLKFAGKSQFGRSGQVAEAIFNSGEELRPCVRAVTLNEAEDFDNIILRCRKQSDFSSCHLCSSVFLARRPLLLSFFCNPLPGLRGDWFTGSTVQAFEKFLFQSRLRGLPLINPNELPNVLTNAAVHSLFDATLNEVLQP